MIKAESKEFIDILDHFVTRAVDINKQHGGMCHFHLVIPFGVSYKRITFYKVGY